MIVEQNVHYACGTACWCAGAGAVPAAQQLHGAPGGPHAELQGRRLVPPLAPLQAHLPTLQWWDITFQCRYPL